ncbi:MAG: hypothetical protein IPL52_00305 [Flavobacteriales bacterium]|nr:hypothetical protein [Flavobacteriales bacterium]
MSTSAHHHEAYSQAAVEWMDHYLTDTTQFSLDSLRMVWQEVRTPAARYAEATILLEQGEYAAATTMVAAMEIDAQRYPDEYAERTRMRAWITVQDVLGKVIETMRVSGTEGQVIWDCRKTGAGTYTIAMYAASGAQLAVQRAIVKP